MSMRTQTSTETSNNRFWRLNPFNHIFWGKGMKTKIETMEDLRIELAKMGYSENAIQEIFKWIPSTKK
jgi:hypothetical protein